jgi:predicted HTH domain antitoxin
MPIQVSIPDSILQAAELTEDDIASHLKMLLAVDLVRQQALSLYQGAELAGLSADAFRRALTERGVPIPSDPSADVDEQIRRARKSMLDR